MEVLIIAIQDILRFSLKKQIIGPLSQTPLTAFFGRRLTRCFPDGHLSIFQLR